MAYLPNIFSCILAFVHLGCFFGMLIN
jgi:hypothetical protein